jgi:hypothetical protein
MDPEYTDFLQKIHKKGFDFWKSKDVAAAYKSVYDLYGGKTSSKKGGDEEAYGKELKEIKSLHKGIRSSQDGDLVLANGVPESVQKEWRVYVNADAEGGPAIMKILVGKMFPGSTAIKAAKICDSAQLANTRKDTVVIYTDSEENAKAIARQIDSDTTIKGKVVKDEAVPMARKFANGVSYGESPRSWKLSFGMLRSWACAAATVAVCERGRKYFGMDELKEAAHRALPKFGLLENSASRNGPDLEAQPEDAQKALEKTKEFLKEYRRAGFPMER